MRTCSVCGEEKPNSAFHAEPRVRDGLAAACRLCVKANRKGRHQPGKTRSGSSEQMRARGKVRDAVRYGKLIKPDRCAQCGEPTPNHLLDGHHEDYSKPLDVIWLCRSCHGLRADGGVEGHAGTRPTVIACDTGVEKAATVAPEYGVGIKPGPSEANSPAAPDDADYFNMLWDWFTERRGKEDMRACQNDGGLSADDFKDMLDEHEQHLLDTATVDAGVREDYWQDYVDANEARLEAIALLTRVHQLGATSAWRRMPDGGSFNATPLGQDIAATLSSQPVVGVDQK